MESESSIEKVACVAQTGAPLLPPPPRVHTLQLLYSKTANSCSLSGSAGPCARLMGRTGDGMVTLAVQSGQKATNTLAGEGKGELVWAGSQGRWGTVHAVATKRTFSKNYCSKSTEKEKSEPPFPCIDLVKERTHEPDSAGPRSRS